MLRNIKLRKNTENDPLDLLDAIFENVEDEMLGNVCDQFDGDLVVSTRCTECNAVADFNVLVHALLLTGTPK